MDHKRVQHTKCCAIKKATWCTYNISVCVVGHKYLWRQPATRIDFSQREQAKEMREPPINKRALIMPSCMCPALFSARPDTPRDLYKRRHPCTCHTFRFFPIIHKTWKAGFQWQLANFPANIQWKRVFGWFEGDFHSPECEKSADSINTRLESDARRSHLRSRPAWLPQSATLNECCYSAGILHARSSSERAATIGSQIHAQRPHYREYQTNVQIYTSSLSLWVKWIDSKSFLLQIFV